MDEPHASALGPSLVTVHHVATQVRRSVCILRMTLFPAQYKGQLKCTLRGYSCYMAHVAWTTGRPWIASLALPLCDYRNVEYGGVNNIFC